MYKQRRVDILCDIVDQRVFEAAEFRPGVVCQTIAVTGVAGKVVDAVKIAVVGQARSGPCRRRKG